MDKSLSQLSNTIRTLRQKIAIYCGLSSPQHIIDSGITNMNGILCFLKLYQSIIDCQNSIFLYFFVSLSEYVIDF